MEYNAIAFRIYSKFHQLGENYVNQKSNARKSDFIKFNRL